MIFFAVPWYNCNFLFQAMIKAANLEAMAGSISGRKKNGIIRNLNPPHEFPITIQPFCGAPLH